MARIVLVSNRVDNTRAAQAGGMSVVLASVLERHACLWFGWNGKINDHTAAGLQLEERRSRKGTASSFVTLSLNAQEHREYYLGYSNSVLWPVFHNRLDLAQFEAGYFERYVCVNRRFAEALKPYIKPTDIIWVHDYHLLPLATELRRAGINNPIGLFLHIPVPPAQTFLAIPEHKILAKAFSDYDLVGLQTSADVANLIKFLEDGVAGRILQDGKIKVFDRELAVGSYPVGIDPVDFSDVPENSERPCPLDRIRIAGVDRLDYTKGLPEKFRAFGRFLEKYPNYRNRVILMQIAPPTRESVEAYSDIRTALEALSGKINGQFGEIDWVPIHYMHRSTKRSRLREIYRSSRIGLVTPLRDGMNIVVKEYIAAQDPSNPGVPVLSRFAGAAEQLREALIVNPYNIEEVADAIREALEMALSDRVARHQCLLNRVQEQSSFAWAQSFLKALEKAASERQVLSKRPLAFRRALQRMSAPHSR